MSGNRFQDDLDRIVQEHMEGADDPAKQAGVVRKGLEDALSIIRYCGKPDHPVTEEVLELVQDPSTDYTPESAVGPLKGHIAHLKRREATEGGGALAFE